MNPAPLTLITTGGTIDGTCYDLGTISSSSGIEALLRNDPRFTLSVVNLFNIDSRELTSDNREALLETILNCSTDLVLVGHGTYTICETGRYLKHKIPRSSKYILLVGAWAPFGYPSSDASAQVLFAAEKLLKHWANSEGSSSYSPRVSIAMDSQLWDPDNTNKVLSSEGKWQLANSY